MVKFIYLEIKNLLLAEGIIFETTGDTEVLVSFNKWGIDSIFVFSYQNSGNLAEIFVKNPYI